MYFIRAKERNKSLLGKRINISASDYRFVDKVTYYQGFVNGRGQEKEGTKIYGLLEMARTRSNYTEGDILQRNNGIFFVFLEFARNNRLGQQTKRNCSAASDE